MARIKLKNLLIKLTKNKNLNMFTKHNNKPPTIESASNARCYYPPAFREGRLSQHVGDAKEGSKTYCKLKYSIKSK